MITWPPQQRLSLQMARAKPSQIEEQICISHFNAQFEGILGTSQKTVMSFYIGILGTSKFCHVIISFYISHLPLFCREIISA